MKKPRKQNDWGTIYRNALARGDDHGYAAFLADEWERRQARKKEKLCNGISAKARERTL